MPPAPIEVDRALVLAYRASAQGLHREAAAPADVAGLDLGVQDSPPGSAAVAFAARTRQVAAPSGLGVDDGLATTWSHRGAPHVHRGSDLLPLSRALWPWSDDDALARLDTSPSPVRSSALEPREALRFVAEHIAAIVTEPLPKGEVSTRLTPELPAELTVDCRVCAATHIVETLFRTAVLPAGIRFEPSRRTVTFAPAPNWPGVPEDAADPTELIVTYLRRLGPAGPAEVAAFIGARTADVASRWPEELVEVRLEGGPGWLPEDAVDGLRDPPDPPPLRLLPPSDPWLQARDRDLIVPDAGHRKELWPILGRPGALLVDGEVAGTWRARKQGRRVAITVQPFGRMTTSMRRHLDDEAAVVARAKGVTEASVVVES